MKKNDGIVKKALHHLSMEGLHVFEAYDETYLIHADSSALFRITPIAHEYLSGLEKGDNEQELWKRLNQRYDGATMSEFRSSLANLTEGLKHLPSARRITRERMLQALINHHPRNIMLFITNVCNLQCTYCYERYPGRQFKPRHLGTEEVTRILDHYIKRSGKRSPLTVTFFGGEPLLNFEVLKAAVHYCREKQRQTGQEFYFCITTNATTMTEEMADFLVEHQFGVMASLDGPEEVHDRFRKYPNGKGTYRQVAGNIKMLLAKQREKRVLPVKLRATMTKENYQQYNDLNRFFKDEFPGARIMIGETTGTVGLVNEWDVPRGDTEFQHQWFDQFHSEILSTPVNEVGVEYRDQVRSMREIHRKINTPKLSPHLPEICGVGRNMLAVSSDGKLYPCHRFIGMNRFTLGDKESGLREDRLIEYYASLIDNYQEHCSPCWAKTFCGGDCPAFLAVDDGTIRPPAPERCSSLKRAYELSISIYFTIQEKRPDIFKAYIAGSEDEEG